MKKRALAFIAIIACAALAAAVLVRPPRHERKGRLALATILPLADIARNVAGDRFRVETLLPPGASPHTFEPTARELMSLSDAEIVFRIGLDLELWADRLVTSAGGERLRIVTVSDGLDLMPNEPDGPDEADARAHRHDDGHAHEAGELNPHVWLDPVNVLAIVETMVGAFAEADPEGARVYAANAARYVNELARLDGEYRRALAGIERKRVVAFHNSFAYLAR
ncbi:MAG: metal ABC transporter substrate-binding protein, partial [Planctomycetota bacterium]